MNKEIKEEFTNIIDKKIRSIEKLEGGFSNENYLINDAYVFRKVSPLKDESLSFIHEKEIYETIEQLNCSDKVIYYNVENGNKIAKYIHGTRCYYQTPTDEQIIYVAKLIKKIQKSNIKVSFEYDAMNKINLYKSILPPEVFIDKNYEDKVFKEYLKIYEKYDLVLSHNDLVKGNLLFKFNGVFFIDWEYASMNIPLFDLASFISENNLNNEQASLFLNKFYGAKLSQTIIKRLDIVIRFQDILFYYWALYNFKRRHNEIFKIIGDEKLAQIQKTSFKL